MKCSLGISNFLEEISRLSHSFVFLYFFAWEKAMAPHSSTVARKIPWMEEPGRLQSMGSLRVGPYWATSLSLFTFMYWRRKWQPTPVFLPGESQGQRSLVGCSPWGRTESDTTKATWQRHFFALVTEEGFLIFSCYSLELCIQMGISFLFSFSFHLSSIHSYL